MKQYITFQSQARGGIVEKINEKVKEPGVTLFGPLQFIIHDPDGNGSRTYYLATLEIDSETSIL